MPDNPHSSQRSLSSSDKEQSESAPQQLPPNNNNNNNNNVNDNSVFNGIVFEEVDPQGLLNDDVNKINRVTLGAIRKSRHDESQALEQANLLEAQINELKAQQLQLESQQLQAQQRAAAEKGKREGIRIERHLQLDSRKEERTKYSGVALTVDAHQLVLIPQVKGCQHHHRLHPIYWLSWVRVKNVHYLGGVALGGVELQAGHALGGVELGGVELGGVALGAVGGVEKWGVHEQLE